MITVARRNEARGSMRRLGSLMGYSGVMIAPVQPKG
jgi:hypothetical protein